MKPRRVSLASVAITLSLLLGALACAMTAQASTQLGFSPSQLSFGNQTVGTTSSSQNITIQNTGASSVTFSLMSTGGNFYFAGSGTCKTGVAYAAGASCTVSINFKPSATGTRTGYLTLNDNSSTPVQSVLLTGTGVSSTSSTGSTGSTTSPITLTPNPLSFGNQTVGATSSTQYVTIKNSGTSSISFSNMTMSGPFAFAGTGTCNLATAYAAGSSCTVSVHFSPTSTGTQSGTLTVSDNAGTGTQTVSLIGSGVSSTSTSAPSISTSSLPGGTVGQSYSSSLSATGGTSPYSWSVASGSLPGGLSLSSAGAISGTPSASGSFSFTAKVTDSTSQTATKSLSISVAVDPAPTTSCSVYVSPSGSDSNPGTLSAPWQTLNHAFADVQPGQTLCLRGGTYPQTTSSGYSQTMSTAGSSSSLITITNYPGEVAVIQGPTRIETSYVKFLGTPNNSINMGLVFQGTSQLMDVVDVMNSHDVTLDHVEIRDGGYHAGIYQYGGYNIKLLGSYIHDNGRPGFSNTDNGVYWDATTGGGNLIANCVVEHNVAQGIQLYPSPSNVVVEENTFVNNGNWVALYGSNNTFVNNIVSGNGTASGNPQIDIEGTGYTINSNLVWDSNSSQAGILNSTGQSILSMLTANPLFVDPSNHNYQLQTGSLAISSGNSSYSQPVDMNNVTRTMPPSRGAYQQ